MKKGGFSSCTPYNETDIIVLVGLFLRRNDTQCPPNKTYCLTDGEDGTYMHRSLILVSFHLQNDPERVVHHVCEEMIIST